MPQFSGSSKYHNEQETQRLNDNRHGSMLDFLEDFTNRFPTYVDEYETLLTDNRIWKQRTVNIGVVSPERAMQLGFTGPMLRGAGVEWDLRKKQPYDVYDQLDFDIPVGKYGDCYGGACTDCRARGDHARQIRSVPAQYPNRLRHISCAVRHRHLFFLVQRLGAALG